jgi:Mg2+-importing ATPase
MASSPVFRSEHASLEAYWAQDAAALLRRLDSGLGGLSRREAARRRFGLKSWSIQPDRYAILRLILKQFKSPLVLILVAASLISVFIRDWVEASVVVRTSAVDTDATAAKAAAATPKTKRKAK